MSGPPPEWDADEAAQRIRAEAHRRPEHRAHLTAQREALKDEYEPCRYCEKDEW